MKVGEESKETFGDDVMARRIEEHAIIQGKPNTNDYGSQDSGLEPYTTLGQFSFAPATQTTVVTTTTTTTTKFPPFLIRPPRRIREFDPKLYPLAASPTPSNLRTISFTLDGRATVFREADDTNLALEQLHNEEQNLRNANGTLHTVEKFEPHIETDVQSIPNPFAYRRRSSQERPASPQSISETEEGMIQATASGSTTTYSSTFPVPSQTGRTNGFESHPRIRGMRSSNPITPDSQGGRKRISRRTSNQNLERHHQSSDTLLPSPYMENQPTFPRSQMQSISISRNQNGLSDEEMANSAESSLGGHNIGRLMHPESAVPTPPVETDDAHINQRPLSRRALSSIPSRLHVSESPSGNDGSLPSPSLSPVTAAATIQNAGYFADVDSNSDGASQHEYHMLSQDESFHQTPSRSLLGLGTESSANQRYRKANSHFATKSVSEIPTMLDFFESMPDEMKSYVMHQLLRRCPKATLHMVADAVNPSLKCDFLSLLPPELGLNILNYLDLKSLCKAAQVSKKWRQMINGDEKAWKELFDANGFTLADGELQRAITEGWGWQDPYGLLGFEDNLNLMNGTKTESEANTSPVSSPQSQKGLTGLLRRSKRKAATMLSARNKQAKRKIPTADISDDLKSVGWMSQMSTAEGPYNAANAAILAVPHPKVAIPSLKGLHLYKSLYRRHHLIRRNWLYEDTKPRHIAFRAHDTHVVTCLQFDTDKILTGSDDNNINVYNTDTGALRAKLKGHEGGVWALQYEGNTLVSGSTDRSVRVWDIEQGLEKHVFRGHTSTVRCLQIVAPTKVGESADGKPVMMPKQPLIITGSRDSTLRVWKLPRPEDPSFIQTENDNDMEECPFFVRTLTGHQLSVRAIAAHADTLVSGSYDCTVRVWRISTGETVYRLQGHTQKVYSVVLDHARNRCISGSMDNMVRIWSLETGSLLHSLEGHTSLVGLLDLNSERLVSAAADSTLRIWDPENGQCKATLSAHTGAITCFQHDGQKVISGSDRTLKLWNIKTGECIKDLLSDLSGVWQVKFNERRCVAAVQRDGLTHIEVLDFGAARDGIPQSKRGRRIVVDINGFEVVSEENGYLDLEVNADA